MTLFKNAVALVCSLYLTLILNLHFQLSQTYILVAGLIIYSLIYYFLTRLSNRFDNSGIDKRLVLYSLGFAGLLGFAFPSKLNPVTEKSSQSVIRITATGQKNDSSHSAEVWIPAIYNDNVAIDLNTITLPEGWEMKNNSLVSYTHQPATLEITIKDPVSPKIIFVKHPWSGVVKIDEGGQSKTEDLYSNQDNNSVEYNSNQLNEQPTGYSRKEKIILLATTIFGLAILCYVVLQFAYPYWMPAVLCYFLFFFSGFFTLGTIDKSLLLIVSLAVCFLMKNANLKEFIGSTPKIYKAIFLLVVLYAGFAFIGHRLFLAEYPVNEFAQKLAFYGLFCCWLSFLAIAFLYITNLLKFNLIKRNTEQSYTPRYSTLKVYAIFLGILLLCWSFYFIAFYPANMSGDSMDEWLQAKGAYLRNDWHPYIYTLVIEALQSIWFSPASIAITQILFMAAVCASFLVFLYKTGIRLPLLIGFAILVGIVPANGMMVTTVWKDIPYCCALLWLTLILTEIITKTYIFNFKVTIACFVVSLIIAGLFRHNGTAAVFFIAIAIIYWAIKNKNRAVTYSTGLALLVIISYKSIILPHWLKIVPAPAGMHLTAPLHGIAEVIYYNGKLTNETKREMNSILPDSVWITRYDPYNIDLYLFHTNTPFVANISKMSTATVAKCYAKTFIDNPYLIIRDRLNATELMWNITQPEKSFNYTFQTTLEESYNTEFKQHDNALKSFFLKELDYSEKLADPILRRPGLFNILTLLLCLLFIKQRRSYGLIFLPVLASNLTLVILMTHQSFRYLYYVPLVFGFLWLLTLSNSILFNFSKNPSINNNHS